MQPQFQPATTTASRVKCLFLHIDKHHGRPRADAFLVAAKLDRGYLDDETSPIPVEAWFRALTSFTSHWGRAELQEVVASHVHPENLGVWARVLRGAESPNGAFRQLGQLGGEEILTERWETIELGQHHWVGHVLVRADQPEERDGLCCLARASELSSIPLLFGLPCAKVHCETISSSRPDTLEQRYRVEWNRIDTRLHWLLACVGGVIGTAVAFLRFPASLGGWAGLLPLAGAAIGFISGLLQLEFRTRTLNNAAQVMRLLALERSVALREARERRESGLLEGGVVAGQYRLGSKLGVGASGAIWEAVRLSDGRVVAIKLLRAAVAHDTVAADRLRREAAALGLAWHPNVVEVYDDGHLPDGTSYLVMERLYGESLSERLRRVGTIAPDQLLPIALQVCDALGAVHAAGIVHRDLKPSNIFISKGSPNDPQAAGSEQAERVKLLDFGIARVEWAETRLTNAGAPLGTPGYMSPEQEQGLEIDARSDLFSLGSILFECLTGSPPPMTSAEFRSEPRGPIVDSTVQLAFRQIPDRWRAVVERVTDPLPRHRYPDARAMKDALLELCESPPAHVEAAESPPSDRRNGSR